MRAPRVSEFGVADMSISMDVDPRLDQSPIQSTSFLGAPDSSPLPAGFLDKLSDMPSDDQEDDEGEGVSVDRRRSRVAFEQGDESMDYSDEEDEGEGDEMDITQSVPRTSLARLRRSSTVPNLGVPLPPDDDEEEEEDPLPDDIPYDEDE